MKTLEDYKFTDSDQTTTPSIIQEFIYPSPSVIDRYFTRFYRIFPSVKENEDHLVLWLSNRICLIGLAPNHVAFKKGVTAVRYDIGNVDRSLNMVKGKGKKGGMALQSDSAIAVVKCKDESEYRIQSCVTGKLIETNHRVVENPTLLSVEGQGYIAVVLVKPENAEAVKDSLFTKIQYDMAREPKGSVSVPEG